MTSYELLDNRSGMLSLIFDMPELKKKYRHGRGVIETEPIPVKA